MKLPGSAQHPNDVQSRQWRVMRQDDNGNRFVVASTLTEPEARLLSASYAARGHKQLYWAEPTAVTEPREPAEPTAVTEPPAPANRS